MFAVHTHTYIYIFICIYLHTHDKLITNIGSPKDEQLNEHWSMNRSTTGTQPPGQNQQTTRCRDMHTYAVHHMSSDQNFGYLI